MSYGQKLISLVERYELHKLDEDVLGDTYVKYEVTEEVNSMRYRVVKGDTLYSISKKYNLSVKELQRLNGLKDNTLSIGQELVVTP